MAKMALQKTQNEELKKFAQKIIDEAKSSVDHLQELLDHDHEGSAAKHAKYFRDKVIPTMTTLREGGDALESLVPQNVWPLPTYREMLFMK